MPNERKWLLVLPQNDGEMLFSFEFDTYVHEKCLTEARQKSSANEEARIMAHELLNL